jgi:hypothetical protein
MINTKKKLYNFHFYICKCTIIKPKKKPMKLKICNMEIQENWF